MAPRRHWVCRFPGHWREFPSKLEWEGLSVNFSHLLCDWVQSPIDNSHWSGRSSAPCSLPHAPPQTAWSAWLRPCSKFSVGCDGTPSCSKHPTLLLLTIPSQENSPVEHKYSYSCTHSISPSCFLQSSLVCLGGEVLGFVTSQPPC